MADITQTPIRTSQAFSMFSYVNFIVAATMMAGGVYFLEASFAAKGFYAMAALMLVTYVPEFSMWLPNLVLK